MVPQLASPLLQLGNAHAGAIHCLVTTDENYAPFAAVTLASLFHHAQEPVHAHVLTPGLSERSLHGLSTIHSRGAHALTVAYAPPELTPFGALSYWAESAAIRIAAPTLLALDRVIYLDCDVIVRTSLRELYELDLGEHLVAGVPDLDAVEVAATPRLNWLNLPIGDMYLNSGVMLMDLEKLRQMQFLQQARDWVAAHGDKRILPDQCAINGVLAGKKLALENRWNWCRVRLGPVVFLERLLSAKPTVLHFNGATKPWMKKAHPALREAWQHYLALTDYTVAEVERPPIRAELLGKAQDLVGDAVLALRELRATTRGV